MASREYEAMLFIKNVSVLRWSTLPHINTGAEFSDKKSANMHWKAHVFVRQKQSSPNLNISREINKYYLH